ncbi:MAG: DCC1-like thiol-disulfide oxidoreductase family protein [Bdellovibrionota bacterium]
MKIPVLGRNVLLYDGECPFCSSVSRYYAMKTAFPGLEIISLRDAESLRPLKIPKDVNFNLGMILIQSDGTLLQAAEAFQAINERLPLETLKECLLFGLNSKKWIARLSYPLVYAARAITLKSRRIPLDLPRVDLPNDGR